MIKYNMMKKRVLLPLILFLFVFIACSNNQTLKISYQDTETLKDTIKEKEMDTRWAEEMESDRLSKNLDLDPKIVSKEVTKDNQTVKILKKYQQPVYAQLDNFGSVDTSILTKNQLSFINDFLNFVSTEYNQDPDDYFLAEYKFNYQFFIQDLKEIWENDFGFEFPEIKIEEKKSEQIDNQETETTKEENKVKLFEKWIIGEPVKYENQILIPVHVYLKDGYLNLLISSNNDVTIKLYNVKIEKWGN